MRLAGGKTMIAARTNHRRAECWCDTEGMLEDGALYHDGQIVPCPECGYPWQVSCDSETAPYLIDPEADEARR